MTTKSKNQRNVLATLAFGLSALGMAATATGAEILVNSEMDEVDAHPGNGVCETSSGVCTLRAAIMEANASQTGEDGRPFTIVLPEGYYQLSIPNPLSTAELGLDEVPDRPLTSSESSGSLLISTPMFIRGAGARNTIIDANQLDRVIELERASSSVISDVTITGGAGNTLGGGVYGQSPTRLERVIVTGNVASGGGGIFINPAGTLELVDSTVSHNASLNQAGGIRIDTSGTIINSTISHNRAGGMVSPLPLGTEPAPLTGKGGGVDIRGRDVLIINSTIVHNEAPQAGGGIHFSPAYTDTAPHIITDLAPEVLGELYLINTIVALNHSDFGPDNCRTEVGFITSLGNNLDSDDTCSLTHPGDLVFTDPRIDALGDHGGPTDTHALLEGSPAIDSGSDKRCALTDQRGVERPQGAGCDIGAYEREETKNKDKEKSHPGRGPIFGW